MSSDVFKKPCAACDATGRGSGAPASRCHACIGRGVVWSDNRPLTKCPETVTRLTGPASASFRACDRRRDACPGCSRTFDVIGGPDDARSTAAHFDAETRGGQP